MTCDELKVFPWWLRKWVGRVNVELVRRNHDGLQVAELVIALHQFQTDGVTLWWNGYAAVAEAVPSLVEALWHPGVGNYLGMASAIFMMVWDVSLHVDQSAARAAQAVVCYREGVE